MCKAYAERIIDNVNEIGMVGKVAHVAGSNLDFVSLSRWAKSICLHSSIVFIGDADCVLDH